MECFESQVTQWVDSFFSHFSDGVMRLSTPSLLLHLLSFIYLSFLLTAMVPTVQDAGKSKGAAVGCEAAARVGEDVEAASGLSGAATGSCGPAEGVEAAAAGT